MLVIVRLYVAVQILTNIFRVISWTRELEPKHSFPLTVTPRNTSSYKDGSSEANICRRENILSGGDAE